MENKRRGKATNINSFIVLYVRVQSVEWEKVSTTTFLLIVSLSSVSTHFLLLAFFVTGYQSFFHRSTFSSSLRLVDNRFYSNYLRA